MSSDGKLVTHGTNLLNTNETLALLTTCPAMVPYAQFYLTRGKVHIGIDAGLVKRFNGDEYGVMSDGQKIHGAENDEEIKRMLLGKLEKFLDEVSVAKKEQQDQSLGLEQRPLRNKIGNGADRMEDTGTINPEEDQPAPTIRRKISTSIEPKQKGKSKQRNSKVTKRKVGKKLPTTQLTDKTKKNKTEGAADRKPKKVTANRWNQLALVFLVMICAVIRVCTKQSETEPPKEREVEEEPNQDKGKVTKKQIKKKLYDHKRRKKARSQKKTKKENKELLNSEENLNQDKEKIRKKIELVNSDFNNWFLRSGRTLVYRPGRRSNNNKMKARRARIRKGTCLSRVLQDKVRIKRKETNLSKHLHWLEGEFVYVKVDGKKSRTNHISKERFNGYTAAGLIIKSALLPTHTCGFEQLFCACRTVARPRFVLYNPNDNVYMDLTGIHVWATGYDGTFNNSLIGRRNRNGGAGGTASLINVDLSLNQIVGTNVGYKQFKSDGPTTYVFPRIVPDYRPTIEEIIRSAASPSDAADAIINSKQVTIDIKGRIIEARIPGLLEDLNKGDPVAAEFILRDFKHRRMMLNHQFDDLFNLVQPEKSNLLSLALKHYKHLTKGQITQQYTTEGKTHIRPKMATIYKYKSVVTDKPNPKEFEKAPTKLVQCHQCDTVNCLPQSPKGIDKGSFLTMRSLGCGVCGHDLKTGPRNLPKWLTPEQKRSAGLLERITFTQNVLDASEIGMSDSLSRKIEMADYRLVVNLFNQMRWTITSVPEHLDILALSTIARRHPSVEFSCGQLVDPTRNLTMPWLVASTIELTNAILRTKVVTIGWPDNRYGITIDKDLEGFTKAIIAINESSILTIKQTLQEGAPMVAYAMYDYENSSGPDTYGNLSSNGHTMTLTIGGTNSVNMISKNNHHNLTNHKVLTAGDNVYGVVELAPSGPWKWFVAYKLTNYDEVIRYIHTFDSERIPVSIKVPVIDKNSAINWIAEDFAIKWIDVKIKPKLLHALMDRAMTANDTNIDAIITTGIAFAYRRYNVRDHVLTNLDISAEEVLGHAAIVSLLVRRAKLRRETILEVNEASPIQQSIGKTIHLISEVLTEQLGSHRVEIVSKIMAKLTDAGVVDEMDNLWSFTTSLEEYRTTKKKHGVGSITVEEIVFRVPGHDECLHVGDDECIQCGLPTTGALCTCCGEKDHKHTCDHGCAGHGTTTTLMCWCCGTPGDIECRGCRNVNWEDSGNGNLWVEHKPKTQQTSRKIEKEIETKPGYIKPLRPAIRLSGDNHEHVCPKCLGYYSHEHKYKNPKHDLRDDECPFCDNNAYSKPVNKQYIPKGDSDDDEDFEFSTMITIDDKLFYKTAKCKCVEFGAEKFEHTCNQCGINYLAREEYHRKAFHLQLVGECPHCDKGIVLTDKDGVTAAGALFASITSKEYAQHILDGKKYQSKLNGDWTVLDHIPLGEQPIPTTNVNIISIIPVATQNSTCGYDSIKYFYGKEFPTNVWSTMSSGRTHYELNTFLLIAKELELNLIIVESDKTTIVRNNHTQEYGAIVHSTTHSRTPYHWEPAKISISDLPKITCYDDSVSVNDLNASAKAITGGTLYSNLDTKSKVEVQLQLYEQLKFINVPIEWPVVTNVDGKLYLSNNDESKNTTKGHIHIPIPSWWPDISGISGALTSLSYGPLADPYDAEDDISNLTSNRKRMIAEAATTIMQLRRGAGKADATGNPIVRFKTHKCRTIPAGIGKMYIILPDQPFKQGDVVYTGLKTSPIPHIIKPIVRFNNQGKRENRALIIQSRTSTTIDLLVPMTSLASSIYTFQALQRETFDDERLVEVLNKSDANCGPAGAGKTYSIAARIGVDNGTAVYSTSGAYKAMIRELGRNKATVVSLESAYSGKTRLKCKELYIDEANYVSPVIMEIILEDNPTIEVVHAFYDDTQIGYTDLSKVGGKLSTKNITNFIPTTIITNKGRRIGSPLSDVIADVRTGGYESIASHKTEYSVVTMKDFDPAAIVQEAKKNKSEAILCFYHEHVRKINQALQLTEKSSKPTVSTVSSVQGMQWDNVTVVQAALTKNSFIDRDPKYCMSAATRAVKNLKWVSVGMFTQNTTLAVRLKGQAGGGPVLATTYGKLKNIFIEEDSWGALLSKLAIAQREDQQFDLNKAKAAQLVIAAKHGATLLTSDEPDGSMKFSVRYQMMGEVAVYTLSRTGQLNIISDPTGKVEEVRERIIDSGFGKTKTSQRNLNSILVQLDSTTRHKLNVLRFVLPLLPVGFMVMEWKGDTVRTGFDEDGVFLTWEEGNDETSIYLESILKGTVLCKSPTRTDEPDVQSMMDKLWIAPPPGLNWSDISLRLHLKSQINKYVTGGLNLLLSHFKLNTKLGTQNFTSNTKIDVIHNKIHTAVHVTGDNLEIISSLNTDINTGPEYCGTQFLLQTLIDRIDTSFIGMIPTMTQRGLGLYKSIDEHLAANDSVALLVREMDEKLTMSKWKLKDNVITLASDTDDETKKWLRNLIDGDSITYSGDPEGECARYSALLTLLAHHCSRIGVNIQLVTVGAHVALQSSMWKLETVVINEQTGWSKLWNSKAGAILKRLSNVKMPAGEKGKYANLAEQNLNNRNGPYLYSHTDRSKRKAYMPESIDKIGLEQLQRDDLIFCPELEDGKISGLIWNRNITVPAKTLSWLVSGNSNESGLAARLLGKVAGINCYTVVASSVPRLMVDNPVNNSYKQVKIQVPSIDLDAYRQGRFNDVVRTRSLECPVRVYRQLALNFLRGDRDFNSMVFMGRILLTTESLLRHSIVSTTRLYNEQVYDICLHIVLKYGNLREGVLKAERKHSFKNILDMLTDSLIGDVSGGVGLLIKTLGLDKQPLEMLAQMLLSNIGSSKDQTVLAALQSWRGETIEPKPRYWPTEGAEMNRTYQPAVNEYGNEGLRTINTIATNLITVFFKQPTGPTAGPGKNQMEREGGQHKYQLSKKEIEDLNDWFELSNATETEINQILHAIKLHGESRNPIKIQSKNYNEWRDKVGRPREDIERQMKSNIQETLSKMAKEHDYAHRGESTHSLVSKLLQHKLDSTDLKTLTMISEILGDALKAKDLVRFKKNAEALALVGTPVQLSVTEWSHLNVAVVVLGSRGDIIPAKCAAMTLTEAGANVTLFSPIASSDDERIGYSQFELDWNLEEALTAEAKAKGVIGMIQASEKTAWLCCGKFPYRAIMANDLIIGSPITVQALAAAAISKKPFIELDQMPYHATNINPNLFDKIWEKFDRNFVLTTNWHVIEKEVALLGSKVTLEDLITYPRTPIGMYGTGIIEGEKIIDHPCIGPFLVEPDTKRRCRQLKPKTIVVTQGSMVQSANYAKIVEVCLDLIGTQKVNLVFVGSKFGEELMRQGCTADEKESVWKSGTVACIGYLDYVGSLRKDTLFINHGGAGTVAAGYYSSTYQVIVPVAYDQKMWGTIIHKKNAGVMVDKDNLTTEMLAKALETCEQNRIFKGQYCIEDCCMDLLAELAKLGYPKSDRKLNLEQHFRIIKTATATSPLTQLYNPNPGHGIGLYNVISRIPGEEIIEFEQGGDGECAINCLAAACGIKDSRLLYQAQTFFGSEIVNTPGLNDDEIICFASGIGVNLLIIDKYRPMLSIVNDGPILCLVTKPNHVVIGLTNLEEVVVTKMTGATKAPEIIGPFEVAGNKTNWNSADNAENLLNLVGADITFKKLLQAMPTKIQHANQNLIGLLQGSTTNCKYAGIAKTAIDGFLELDEAQVGHSYAVQGPDGLEIGIGVATLNSGRGVLSRNGQPGAVIRLHTKIFGVDTNARPFNPGIKHLFCYNADTKDDLARKGIISTYPTKIGANVTLTICDGRQHHGRNSWDDRLKFQLTDESGQPISGDVSKWIEPSDEKSTVTTGWFNGPAIHIPIAGASQLVDDLASISSSVRKGTHGVYLVGERKLDEFNDGAFEMDGNYPTLVGTKNMPPPNGYSGALREEVDVDLSPADFIQLVNTGVVRVRNLELQLDSGRLYFFTLNTGITGRLQSRIGRSKHIVLVSSRVTSFADMIPPSKDVPTIVLGHDAEDEFEPTPEFWSYLSANQIVCNGAIWDGPTIDCGEGLVIYGKCGVASAECPSKVVRELKDDGTITGSEYIELSMGYLIVQIKLGTIGRLNVAAKLAGHELTLPTDGIDLLKKEMVQPGCTFHNPSFRLEREFACQPHTADTLFGEARTTTGRTRPYYQQKIETIFGTADEVCMELPRLCATTMSGDQQLILSELPQLTSGDILVITRQELELTQCNVIPRLIFCVEVTTPGELHDAIAQLMAMQGSVATRHWRKTNGKLPHKDKVQVNLLTRANGNISVRWHEIFPSCIKSTRQLSQLRTSYMDVGDDTWLEEAGLKHYDPRALKTLLISLGYVMPTNPGRYLGDWDTDLNAFQVKKQNLLAENVLGRMSSTGFVETLATAGIKSRVRIRMATFDEIAKLVTAPKAMKDFIVDPTHKKQVTTDGGLVVFCAISRGKTNNDWWMEEIRQTDEQKGTHRVGFNVPRIQPTSAAIGLGPGLGKTTICKANNLFLDHDTITPAHPAQIQKYVASNDFETLARIHREAKVPRGKILLTWGPETCPTYCKYLGTIKLDESSADFSMIEDDERRRLAILTHTSKSPGRLSVQKNRDNIRTKVIQWASQWQSSLLGGAKQSNDYTVTSRDVQGTESLVFGGDTLYDSNKPSWIDHRNYDLSLPFRPYIDNVDISTKPTPVIRENPSLTTLDIWYNTDLTLSNYLEAANNDTKLRTWGHANSIKSYEKYLLTDYPENSRPVLTKRTYATERAAAIRMGNVPKYKKHSLNVKNELDSLTKAFFRPDWRQIASSFSPITVNSEKIKGWLQDREGKKKIVQALNLLLEEGWPDHPINVANVHAKLESLLKSNPITEWDQQEIRIIVWHAKEVASVFSSIFLESKKRFKQLLKDEVIYADGMTPDQLRMVLTGVAREDSDWLFESDQKKQDMMTTHDELDVEFEVYKICGVDSEVLNLYRQSHNNWRFKGENFRGRSDAMRWTGQVTTALGNVIINMLVHSDLINSNPGIVKKCFLLGDDNAMILKRKISVDKFIKRTKHKYNMISEVQQQQDWATFLQMVIHPTEQGNYGIGPDFIRLRNRFEVTNGIGTDPATTLLERASSYISMLGDTESGRKANKDLDLQLELVNWYNEAELVKALAKKHELPVNYIHYERDLLIQMLTSPTIKRIVFNSFVTAKSKRGSLTCENCTNYDNHRNYASKPGLEWLEGEVEKTCDKHKIKNSKLDVKDIWRKWLDVDGLSSKRKTEFGIYISTIARLEGVLQGRAISTTDPRIFIHDKDNGHYLLGKQPFWLDVDRLYTNLPILHGLPVRLKKEGSRFYISENGEIPENQTSTIDNNFTEATGTLLAGMQNISGMVPTNQAKAIIIPIGCGKGLLSALAPEVHDYSSNFNMLSQSPPVQSGIVLASDRPSNGEYIQLALTAPHVDTGPPDKSVWTEEMAAEGLRAANVPIQQQFSSVADFVCAFAQFSGVVINWSVFQCDCGAQSVLPVNREWQLIHARGWKPCSCGKINHEIGHKFNNEGQMYDSYLAKTELQEVGPRFTGSNYDDWLKSKYYALNGLKRYIKRYCPWVKTGKGAVVKMFSNGGRTILEKAWPRTFVTHGHLVPNIVDWCYKENESIEAFTNKNVILLIGDNKDVEGETIGLNHNSLRRWALRMNPDDCWEPPKGDLTPAGFEDWADREAYKIGHILTRTYQNCPWCNTKPTTCDELSCGVIGTYCENCLRQRVAETDVRDNIVESNGIGKKLWPTLESMPLQPKQVNVVKDHLAGTTKPLVSICKHDWSLEDRITLGGTFCYYRPDNCCYKCGEQVEGVRDWNGTMPHGFHALPTSEDQIPDWYNDVKSVLKAISHRYNFTMVTSTAGQPCNSRMPQIIWTQGSEVNLVSVEDNKLTITVPVKYGRELASCRLFATLLPGVTVFLSNGRGEEPGFYWLTREMHESTDISNILDAVCLEPTGLCAKSCMIRPGQPEIANLAAMSWDHADVYGHDEATLYQFKHTGLRYGRRRSTVNNVPMAQELTRKFGFIQEMNYGDKTSGYSCCRIKFSQNDSQKLNAVDLIGVVGSIEAPTTVEAWKNNLIVNGKHVRVGWGGNLGQPQKKKYTYVGGYVAIESIRT
jgi:UDP-N-acetylglucosamine:LPS N-acetylglucosamine transferase